MAKVPVEVIIKALDRTAPALNAAARNMVKLRATVARLNPFGGLTRAIQGSAFGSAFGRMRRAMGLGALGAQVEGLKSRVLRLGEPLKQLGTRLAGLSVAGVGMGAAMMAASVRAGGALQQLSARAGTSVDWFASTRYAAEQAGVGGEVFGAAMGQLNKQLGEMTVGTGGPMLAFLRQVSPTLATQMKGAKTSEAAMELLAKAFGRIEDPQRRAALAAKVFGAGAVQMGDFLHAGNASIDERRQRFLALAGSQEALAKNAEGLQTAMKDAHTAFGGLRDAAMAQLMPAIALLARTAADFMAAHRDELREWASNAAAAIKAWVDSGGIQRLVDGLQSVARVAGWLVDRLGATGTALAAVAALSPSMVAGLVGIVAQAGKLVFTLLPPLATGVWAAVTAMASWAATAIPAAMTALGGFAVAAWAAVAPLLPFIAAGAALAFLGKTIYDNWDELAYTFRDLGNSLRWAIIDTWAKVKPILEKMAAYLGPLMGAGFNAALSVGDTVVDKLTPEAASAAAPQPAETTVKVDFTNLPRGARVATESTAGAVDTSLGYAAVTP